MNKSYRLIWNELLATWVAVAENVKSRGKRASGAVLLAAAGFIAVPPAPTFAQVPPPSTQLPSGGQVVGGSAAITQSGAAMTINQSSQRTAIDWQTFNIGSAASVHFQQPVAGVALNRVSDANASQIFGRLTATGQVFLSNPGGVYFAPGASVDVGGLVATTHKIGLADFMAGKTTFERNGATGSVINAGELKAAALGNIGGYIALLAPEVRNQGVIVANLGTVALAAGETFELQFDSNNTLAGLRVTPSTIKALIENKNAVLAPGGLVILSARAVDALQGSVVHSGEISASSLVSKGGRILLEGDDISLKTGSTLTASGATGGGEVLVGGGWQGSGDMHQATTVSMESGASIDVSATKVGAGGTAVLWSDVSKDGSITQVNGEIIAKGGAEGGDGGKVETSGHALNIDGISVDAGAGASGKAGHWLLDPYNYIINVTQATAIGSALNSADVTVTTTVQNTSYGSTTNSADVGDIDVYASIAKTAASGTTTLTLKANRSVVMNTGTSINGATGAPLNVVLWADTDSAGGGGVYLRTVDTKGGHLYVGGGSAGR